jgi:hypothetical protein
MTPNVVAIRHRETAWDTFSRPIAYPGKRLRGGLGRPNIEQSTRSRRNRKRQHPHDVPTSGVRYEQYSASPSYQ